MKNKRTVPLSPPQSYLLKDYLWLDTILSTYQTVEEIMDTTGKDTYVKNGFRISEGDVAVKMRLDYNLRCTNTVFDIIVRNNIPVSIQIYGGRIDIPVDGHYNSGYVESLKRKWRAEGYVSDACY